MSGNAHPNIVPYELFKTKTSYVALAVGNDQQWRAFCKLAGLEGLAQDPKFATNAARVENRTELVPIVAARMLSKKAEEWLHLLEEAGIPCGPINTLDRVFSDPQVKARAMIEEVPHPTAGTVKLVN
jgi:formyl-CoA transferase